MKARKLFGQRVRELRKEKSFSMEDLATKADINDKFLGMVERGQQSPSLDTIAKIAKGLNVEIYELFINKALTDKQLSVRVNKLLKEANKEQLSKMVNILETLLH